jgi:hypothetical protein
MSNTNQQRLASERGMDAPSKFATAEEVIAELRSRAIGAAVQLIRMQEGRSGRKERPIDLDRADRRLTAWCTAIEVVTQNGNYYPERTEALNTARRQEAR